MARIACTHRSRHGRGFVRIVPHPDLILAVSLPRVNGLEKTTSFVPVCPGRIPKNSVHSEQKELPTHFICFFDILPVARLASACYIADKWCHLVGVQTLWGDGGGTPDLDPLRVGSSRFEISGAVGGKPWIAWH